jgi:hypothetical protein
LEGWILGFDEITHLFSHACQHQNNFKNPLFYQGHLNPHKCEFALISSIGGNFDVDSRIFSVDKSRITIYQKSGFYFIPESTALIVIVSFKNIKSIYIIIWIRKC